MKQISLPAGRYVVAVSGGVDSMVLLDVLRRLSGVFLVVAHVDHGIRADSHMDRRLVERVSMSHNLPFESVELTLGSDASEEAARNARYKFLRHIQERYAATAIVTAHHQDDLIETAIINLARGTGWRGLSSLRSLPGLVRPFLAIPKAELIAYARKHSLEWREDSTNTNERYLRNSIRSRLAMSAPTDRQKLYDIIVRQNGYTAQIDEAVADWLFANAKLTRNTAILPRYDVIMMPVSVAAEVLQHVMRTVGGSSLQRPQLHRALLFVKAAKAGKVMPLGQYLQLRAFPREVIVEPRENVVS